MREELAHSINKVNDNGTHSAPSSPPSLSRRSWTSERNNKRLLCTSHRLCLSSLVSCPASHLLSSKTSSFRLPSALVQVVESKVVTMSSAYYVPSTTWQAAGFVPSSTPAAVEHESGNSIQPRSPSPTTAEFSRGGRLSEVIVIGQHFHWDMRVSC